MVQSVHHRELDDRNLTVRVAQMERSDGRRVF